MNLFNHTDARGGLANPLFHFVGAPVMHGYNYTAARDAQGGGGAGRVAAAAAPLSRLGFPDNLSFFIWLVVIGVVIPGLLIGGLKAGRFQFVFRGR